MATPIVMERKPGSGRPALKQDEQAHRWLKQRGIEGVATWEMRRAGIGNPSERFRELVRNGVPLKTQRQVAPSGSNGARFWLEMFAPENTTNVEPAPSRGTKSKAPAMPPATPAPARRGPGPEQGAMFEGFGPAWADSRNPHSQRTAA